MKQRILYFALSSFLFARQSITSATLGGTVRDTSGGLIAGVSIAARNLDRNQKWTARTDTQG